MTEIHVSLVSHTNVGKTTLMRTLLRRDIGEVADRPHVTDESEGHILVDTAADDVLRLWDTPGFGDSARLLKRLLASGNPIGWLQSQVWDRFTDRPFFSSQQAVKNVREQSDVVLYLVNAAEDPATAGYVDAELRILEWIGKPVMVLLNQTGPARGREADARDEAAWSRALAERIGTYRVMAMDAFARCWVQEDQLLGEVAPLVPAEKRDSFARLREAWRERNHTVFTQSMQALGEQLAAVATDREKLEPGASEKASQKAMDALARRMDQRERENLDRLIALHGLSGRAGARILERLAGHFEVSRPADGKKTGVIGGAISGAAGGLAADLAIGGLSFGAGALIGAILGALGGVGAAKAYNLMQGREDGLVRWSPVLLRQRWAAALLRYLAVAHYGRGRGDWVEGEYPAQWSPLVDEVVQSRMAELDALLADAAAGAEAPALARRATSLMTWSAREALVRLYPDAAPLFTANP